LFWLGPALTYLVVGSLVLWVSARLSGVEASIRQSALTLGVASAATGAVSFGLASALTVFAPLVAVPACAAIWTWAVHHFMRVGYFRSIVVLVLNGLSLLILGAMTFAMGALLVATILN
jgi:hypothetical protein